MINNIIKMIEKYWINFLEATGVTLLYALCTVLLGTVIGVLVAIMRLSKNKIISKTAGGYIEIIRGTPLLLQMLILYAILAPLIGKYISVGIALFINSSAYVSEIIRAGIQAVDKGQAEAARSLGLSQNQTMKKIILPQAIKNILPALGNEFVTVIKETSVASWFYIGDLISIQKIISGSSNLVIEPYIICGVIYLSLTYGLSRLIRYFEKRLAND